MSILEIEDAVTKLNHDEFVEFIQWIENYNHKVWDEAIEKDLQSGSLESLIADAEKEYDSGLAKPL